jgi:hypothetical protein
MNGFSIKNDNERSDPYSAELMGNRFLDQMNLLTQHHKVNCRPYSRIIELFFNPMSHYDTLEDLPYIPVRAFKEIDLCSVDEGKILKVMMSSGTSGQKPSRIFLDRETSLNQVYALSRIMTSFFGSSRVPMLIVDTKETSSNRRDFNARAAGILGFSMFGSEVFFALNSDYSVNLDAISAFNEKCESNQGIVFGFTSIIWKHLISPLRVNQEQIDFSRASLLHGGGWKNMLDEGVSNESFKFEVLSSLGISNVVNYYGMVEQTGSVFMECQSGFLHSSIYSNVIIRDHKNFDVLSDGNWGLIQLQSLLPVSYPGHSIITEDVGMIHPEFDCVCGRTGKKIAIRGRVPKAEIRGCSDTYEP